MSKLRRSRGSRPDLSGSTFDPDVFFSDGGRSGAPDKKSAQLAARVERILATALECDIEDPQLWGLTLARVEPEPGGARFHAVFVAPPGTDLPRTQQQLEAAVGVFRSALALGLARKRVPGLVLRVVPQEVADG